MDASKYTTIDPQTLNLVRSFLSENGIITIPRILVKLCGGDFACAIILKQIWFWSDQYTETERQGWFYRTPEQWEKDCISEDQIDRRRVKLKAYGVEFRRKKAEGVVRAWYRINNAVFIPLLLDKADDPSLHLDFREARKRISAKRGNARESAKRGNPYTDLDHTPNNTDINTFATANAAASTSPNGKRSKADLDALFESIMQGLFEIPLEDKQGRAGKGGLVGKFRQHLLEAYPAISNVDLQAAIKSYKVGNPYAAKLKDVTKFLAAIADNLPGSFTANSKNGSAQDRVKAINERMEARRNDPKTYKW